MPRYRIIVPEDKEDTIEKPKKKYRITHDATDQKSEPVGIDLGAKKVPSYADNKTYLSERKPDKATLGEVVKTAIPFMPGSQRHPAVRSVLSGLDRVNAGIARIPAYVHGLAMAPYNVLEKAGMTGEYGPAKTPEWLVDNPVAKYYDQSAKSRSFKEGKYKGETFESILERGKPSEIAEWVGHSVLENSPTQLALLGAGLSGASMPGLVSMGLLEAGQAIGEAYEDKDIDPLMATYGATAKGVIESTFEKMGTMNVLQRMSKALASKYGKAKSYHS